MALLSSRSDGRDSAKGALSQMLREINGLKNRTQGVTHYRIPEGNRYLVVVENMCNCPWIYSARESNMPGPVICGLFL